MSFKKNDLVKIEKPIIGITSFAGMSGVVKKVDDEKWVWVSIFGVSDPEPIPFKERELVKADKN